MMNMELASRSLDKRYKKIKQHGGPTFRGIPVEKFSAQDKLKLVYVFAEELRKSRRSYFKLLGCPEFVFRKEIE